MISFTSMSKIEDIADMEFNEPLEQGELDERLTYTHVDEQ